MFNWDNDPNYWAMIESALSKMKAAWAVGYSFHDKPHKMAVNFRLDRTGHY